MKICALVIACFFLSFSQKKNQNDLERLGLHGKVKSVTLRVSEQDQTGNFSDSIQYIREELQFNTDGLLTIEKMYYRDDLDINDSLIYFGQQLAELISSPYGSWTEK